MHQIKMNADNDILRIKLARSARDKSKQIFVVLKHKNENIHQVECMKCDNFIFIVQRAIIKENRFYFNTGECE